MAIDSIDRERGLRNYLGSSPSGKSRAAQLIGLGLVLVLAAISVLTILGIGQMDTIGCAAILVLPGLTCLVWGLGLLSTAASGSHRRKSGLAEGLEDHEVDALLSRGVDSVRAYSSAALGISGEELRTAEARLLTFVSPIAWPSEGLEDEYLLGRRGSDGRMRFGAYGISVLALSRTRLGIFRCDYNFVLDRMLTSDACELRYQDIVSVTTSEGTRRTALPSGERLSKVREIRLSVSNGATIRVVVDVPELWQLAGADEPPCDEAEKAVREIRAMLR